MARIAVIDLLFHWPPQGGSTVHLCELMKRIASFHEICLFVPRVDGDSLRGVIQEDLGFRVQSIAFSRSEFNPWHLQRMIRTHVDRFKPDLVWVADGWTLKPYVLFACKGYRIWHFFFSYEMLCTFDCQRVKDNAICPDTVLSAPLKCSMHTSQKLLHRFYRGGMDRFDKELLISLAFGPHYPLLVKRALRLCQRHVVYGAHYFPLLGAYRGKTTIIPGGVDTSAYCPTKEPRKGVLMVGRVDDPNKGLRVLLEAIAVLSRRGINRTLTVTSKRDYGPNVLSVGWCVPKQMIGLYRRSEVVVVPSLWEEPFGLVALEAAACGIPVVASRIGGLTSIVLDGETGFLFPPGNSLELANCLQNLLANPEEQSRMGEAARQRALTHFNWDVVVQQHFLPLIEADMKICTKPQY
jgi:glycosyltransferase involved in cell wall biosynthesis